MLAHGFDGVKNEITHIYMPDGAELEEFENYKSSFEQCQFICRIIEKAYNAGVAAEGERIADIVNRATNKY